MNIMEIITAVRNMIPVITETIKIVEENFPGTKGAVKLDAAKKILESVYAQSGSIEALWPVISGVISAAVTVYNSTGVFKKSATQG